MIALPPPQSTATVQIVLDSVQAKYPGNEHVRQCGPDNHDGSCLDPSLHHITNRLYLHKENCERMEGVKCDSINSGEFVPINRPVLVDESVERLPLDIRHDDHGIVTAKCEVGSNAQVETDVGTKVVMQNCTLTYVLYRKGVTAPPCSKDQEKYEDEDHQWSCIPKGEK